MKLERYLAWPCPDCSVRSSGFCGAIIDGAPSHAASLRDRVSQVFWRADPINVIRHDSKGYLPGPSVLCKGWACRFYRLPDGRRQILSVLIPGDLFSAFAMLDSDSDHHVQATTDIKFCQLAHDDIKRELATEPAARDAFGGMCSTEMDEAISLSMELNERDPAKRVAGFVRRLVKRLAARGIAIAAGVYPFPLTHTDIADATGLAPGDVNRALQKLRENAILNIANDRITIIDAVQL